MFRINYPTFAALISPIRPIPNKQVIEFYNWQIEPEYTNILPFHLI